MFESKSSKSVLEYFSTDEKTGLSETEAQQRLQKDGENKLLEAKQKSLLKIFLSELNDPMIYVLFAAAIVSLVLAIYNIAKGEEGDLADPIIIFVVVMINATIGTIQEFKANKAMESLKKMSANTATVKRDSKIIEIPSYNLVKGDIVILEEGRTVPADLRLIKSFNLKVDESSLTGESVPANKEAGIVLPENTPIGDRKNLVFMSTPISYGRGEGVVIGTGMGTEIGKIANLLQDDKEEKTPLQKRLADLSKLLGIITLLVVVVLFVVALVQGRNVLDMFMTSISLAVAAIPEGLPAVVAIVLSMGVQRMVKANTIVRKLPSVETLGAVSVVCSDKTGTLTQNKMTVVEAYVDGKLFEKQDLKNPDLIKLGQGLSLCSNASTENGIYGDPTEVALVVFADNLGQSKSIIEKSFPRVDEYPFDSVRKMMSTKHKVSEKNIVFTKGALDQILKHTTKIETAEGVRDITSDDIKEINSKADGMSSRALRVLALAQKEEIMDEKELVFIGIVGMIDPVREEAKPAVATFKKAGIRTVMITGDHLNTAFAIAKELTIVETIDQCMAGESIDKLTFDELKEKVEKVSVYARVSPQNKVSIVEALRANGHICAMTGDGVNDAPSLQKADIGIAMGITGTDVAKGAADMVLTDDNFASIEKAVEEGRSIYANIKKTVLFLLSSNLGEVLTMLVAVIIGLPLPLIAIHILWVNLITDSLPAIALGRCDKDPEAMDNPPRDPKESLFAKGGYALMVIYGISIAVMTLAAFLIQPILHLVDTNTVVSLTNLITLLGSDEALLHEAQTMAFTVLGFSQLFHMVGMVNTHKSFIHVFKSKNWFLPLALFLGITLQVIVVEVPGISDVFKTAQINGIDWLIVLALSLFPLVIHELYVFIIWVTKKVKKNK